ncbi:MAG TPA: rhodanese-like domain-containing protein, partial [Myxococcota bacterium]
MSGTVTADELAALMQKGAVDIVDVREDGEWNSGHIRGARHITLGTIKGDAAAQGFKDGVLFVCAKGMRSVTAAKAAEVAGVKGVLSLEGGTGAWTKAGYELVVDAPAADSGNASAAP